MMLGGCHAEKKGKKKQRLRRKTPWWILKKPIYEPAALQSALIHVGLSAPSSNGKFDGLKKNFSYFNGYFYPKV